MFLESDKWINTDSVYVDLHACVCMSVHTHTQHGKTIDVLIIKIYKVHGKQGKSWTKKYSSELSI